MQRKVQKTGREWQTKGQMDRQMEGKLIVPFSKSQ
jgi:hypothetical protein